jgi:hypothetical protein
MDVIVHASGPFCLLRGREHVISAWRGFRVTACRERYAAEPERYAAADEPPDAADVPAETRERD